jgi:transcriptional regulator with XRE-family HTH domain
MGTGEVPDMIPAMNTKRAFGEQLRDWRQRRHLSQLDLANELQVSTRHLSFVETGRSLPSRAMVLRLAESLDVPLRERNTLLVAAGYAPMYAARPFTDPALSAARTAIELILNGHEPYPALLVDRHWTLVSANRAAMGFLAGVDAALVAPPINVLRVSLHPDGLAPRIVNLAQWRTHVIARLARDLELTADATLAQLITEIRGYPGGEEVEPVPDMGGVAVPLQLRTDAGVLSMIRTTTVFGTAVEVTLSELMLEAFYPADDFTSRAFHPLDSPSHRGTE